jgi:molecular chaperone DnaK
MIEGLAEVPAGNEILVRLDLDLNGILKVTATERATGLAKHVVIDNAMERFRKQKRSDAVDRLESVMGSADRSFDESAQFAALLEEDDDSSESDQDALPPALREAIELAEAVSIQANRVLATANAQDAMELRTLLGELDAAIALQDEPKVRSIVQKVEDLVFYLHDA